MTEAERRRLAAILGMLGSAHPGERAAAALQAEAFRQKHGMTWAELVEGKTVFVCREIIVERQPAPSPPPSPPQRQSVEPSNFGGRVLAMVLGGPAIGIAVILLRGILFGN